MENGEDYVIKGPSLAPAYPYLAANELVSATIGRHLGLPLLDSTVVQMGSDLFFASTYMAKGSFYPQITEDLFNKCENRERVYTMVVFDTWLCNQDRHDRNLLVRAVKRSGSEVYTILPNDHGHCLVADQTPAILPGLLDSPPGQYLKIQYVAEAIRELGKLRQALDAVEAMKDVVLSSAVRSIPEKLLNSKDQGDYENFLMQRRTRLRRLFEDNRACFPKLAGGAI